MGREESFQRRNEFPGTAPPALVQRLYKRKNSIHPHRLFSIHNKPKVHRNTSFLLQVVIMEKSTCTSLCQGLLDLGPPRHRCFGVLTTSGQIPQFKLAPLAPAWPPSTSTAPQTRKRGAAWATLVQEIISRKFLAGRRHHLARANGPPWAQATSSRHWVSGCGWPGKPPSLARGPTW